MKLQRIKINGFKSMLGPVDVCLNGRVPLTLVHGENLDNPSKSDSNGAGKTTILDAICWALYGTTPSGASKDSLIHHGCDEIRVELETDTCTIARYKKRNKSEVLKFLVPGSDWVYGDLSDTQRRLEEFLRIDFGTFCNTVFLSRSSKTVDFVRAKPAERSKVLSNLVDDTAFQKAAALVGKDMTKIEQEVAQEEGKLKQLNKLENQLLAKKHQIEQKLQDITAQHEVKKQGTLKEMAAIKAEIEDLRLAFSVESPTNLASLVHEKTVYQKKLDLVIRRMGADSALLARLSQLDDEENGQCPTCFRTLDEDCMIHLEGVKEKTEDNTRKLEQAEELINKKIASLQREIDKAIDIERRKTDAEQQILNLTREYRLLKDTIQSVSVTHFKQLLTENSQEIADIAEQQAECNTKIIHKKESLQKLKVIKRMFQQELRNILFDKVRTSLDYYTRLYLYQLCGNAVEVQYPPVSKTGAEKFEIILKVGNHEQDLSTFSEGETWRVTFAILLALRRTLLDGNQGDFDFLMVDDPIGALDTTGAREFIRLLGGLASEGSTQIYVTLPRTGDYSELEHNNLCVYKHMGTSTVRTTRF